MTISCLLATGFSLSLMVRKYALLSTSLIMNKSHIYRQNIVVVFSLDNVDVEGMLFQLSEKGGEVKSRLKP